MTTKRAALTDLQFKTLVTVLGQAALSEEGWAPQCEIKMAGGRIDSLNDLVRKGYLDWRRAPFRVPRGPYAGEMLEEVWYSAAE